MTTISRSEAPTRGTPWPFGPKHLKGLCIADWPLSHVESMLGLVQGFPENVYAERQPWIQVLAAEAKTRADAERTESLEQMPPEVDAPDPNEVAFAERDACATLETALRDERVPVFVRNMVRAEYDGARHHAAQHGSAVDVEHLHTLLARLRRAIPQQKASA